MRKLTDPEVDRWRDRKAAMEYYGQLGDDKNGLFHVLSPEPIAGDEVLRVIASADMGWDHVSVSRQHGVPTWAEMEFVKRLFFKDDECAMQLHVPVKEHINTHPNVLHLWRPHATYGKRIPRPPSQMV